jgi:cell division protein FtsA
LSFKVDEQDNIINPLGLYGHSLEVDLSLVSVKSAYIQNVSRLLDHIGCEIKHFFLSGIALSKVVFHQESLKNGTHILCDIGSDITQICLFRNGILSSIKILPIGGDDLTYEIAVALKIPFELAQDIKESYASIGEYKVGQEKEIMIKKDTCYTPVSKKLICEAVTLKAKSLTQSIKEGVEDILPKGEKVNSFLVAGRTVLIDGFLEMMEAALGFPVAMIRFSQSGVFELTRGEVAKSPSRFLNYATALGLIYEGLEAAKSRHFFTTSPYRNPVLKIIHRAREIYQEYF